MTTEANELTIERDRQAEQAWTGYLEVEQSTVDDPFTGSQMFREGFAWGWDAAETHLENQWKAENEFLRDELFRRKPDEAAREATIARMAEAITNADLDHYSKRLDLLNHEHALLLARAAYDAATLSPS